MSLNNDSRSVRRTDISTITIITIITVIIIIINMARYTQIIILSMKMNWNTRYSQPLYRAKENLANAKIVKTEFNANLYLLSFPPFYTI